MHLDTILDLITDRETTAAATADRIREQISLLTTELTRIDGELADLVTARTTLQNLAATEFTADDPTIISSAYQRILAVLGAATAGMPAKDICLALDIEPLPKHVKRARAKLKRLVNRELVTEKQPRIFALVQKQTNLPNRPLTRQPLRITSPQALTVSADAPRPRPANDHCPSGPTPVAPPPKVPDAKSPSPPTATTGPIPKQSADQDEP